MLTGLQLFFAHVTGATLKKTSFASNHRNFQPKLPFNFRQVLIKKRKAGDTDTYSFVEIYEAYHVLKGPKRKSKYDILHEMQFGKRIPKRGETILSWKKKIADAAKKGEERGCIFAQMSDKELKNLIAKNRKKRSYWWIADLIESIIDFFTAWA